MENRVRQGLRAGRPQFGVITTIPSTQVVQVLASCGLDWVLIDLEHGAIDLPGAHAMIAATAGTSTVPLARIAWSHPWIAKPVLDLGVLGVNFPMVRTRADAEGAVRAVRYPPAGERLWGPFYAPLRWGVSMPDYMAKANDEVLSILTIEHPEAIRNIDEIMSVPGVDLAVIGPGDLATALEIPGQFDHPKLLEAIAAAETGILRARVPLGGPARSPEQARRMIDRGYTFIGIGFDWLLLQSATTGFLKGLRPGGA